MRYTFPRTQHLKSRRIIDRLFDRGKPGTLPGKKGHKPSQLAAPPAADAPLTVYAYPFRVLYFRHNPPDVPSPGPMESGTLPLPQAPPCRVLFSVPKRTFKKAVDRNAVRRRVLEAYRLNKHRLIAGADNVPTTGLVAHIAFLYTAKAKISFEEIEKGMKLAFKRMKEM